LWLFFTICGIISRRMAAFLATKSILVCPGFWCAPAVITTAAGAISAVLDLRPLTAVGVSQGGTGLTTPFVVGDMLYASTTLTWARIAAALDGNVLRSAGLSTAPVWGKVRLSGTPVDVTGVLPVASGGTNLTAVGTANQVLGTNAAATAFEHKTLTQGANITITHAANSVTFAAAPGNVGVRQYGFAFVDANSVKVLRTRRYVGTLAIVADVNGTLLTKNDNDLTLTIPTNLPAAFTLTGGSTFTTTISTPTVTATGSSFTTELKVGDTVIVDIAGAPEEFTVKSVDTNLQFTAWQNAGASVANKTGTRGGVTAASRVPDALYFVYLASSGLNSSYLDTAMPVSGYHPRTTTDRWAGIQVYNNPSNALEQTWTWANGSLEIPMAGSAAGGAGYTTTSATYVNVDATNLLRPVYIPIGGSLSMWGQAASLLSAAIGRIGFAEDAAVFSQVWGGTAGTSGSGVFQTSRTRAPATGIHTYSLMYLNTAGTQTIANPTADNEDSGDTFAATRSALPRLLLRVTEP